MPATAASSSNTTEDYSPQDVLDSLQHHGIISTDDIQNIVAMNKKEKVLKVHHQKIWQGSGKDKRWMTRIEDDSSPDGRKKISKKTEKELIDFLYDHYFANEKSYKNCTLTDIYEEWIQYKLTTVNRANTVYRLDADFKKFYLNEPLSQKILTTPLLKLTVADIKEWAYSLIKKYELKETAYYNATSVLRQVYEYLIEKEVASKNPCKLVKINSSAFKKDRKKPAETQIFYQDEINMIISHCIKEAKSTNDFSFLAIPLFFYTGMRIGECLGLAFKDCDEKNNSIYVHSMLAAIDERLPGGTWAKRRYEIVDFLKGNGDPREIIVSKSCFEILNLVQKLQFKTGKISPYLFPDISQSNIEWKLYRICDSLGINRRSPHKWRKTYISKLLNTGADPDFVRNQVGHKELQTTLNSYSYSTSRKEEQLDVLERALSS